MARSAGLTACRAAAVAAACLALSAASPPRDAAEAAGVWELSLENSHRKCPLALSIDEGDVGRQLRFPVGCRRALPIVNGLSGWLVEGGAMRLVGPDRASVLSFPRAGEGEVLRARSAAGEGYTLERTQDLQPVRHVPLPVPEPAVGAPQATFVDPGKAPPFGGLPGTYIVDRYTERDVCRIHLAGAVVGMPGRFQARLLEGCRDAGLSAFDPVAWRYEAGRLTISSRRGHEVTLISERDREWRRDPAVGATLTLRKAQP